MADDRWWRGLDSLVRAAVAPGARILDVGCGAGGLVERLAASGFDAVGVDPDAPAHPRLVRRRVEELDEPGSFDAACAVMALHHADLAPALEAIARLLRPGGMLFVDELAWELYDERCARWLAEFDSSGADHSVAAWRREHEELHTSAAVRAALEDILELETEEPRPYLARMLRMPEREREEQALIEAGALPPLGRVYVARVPDRVVGA